MFLGKIAVITGASTGMGRELALQLVAEGCHVALCDIVTDKLAATQEACRATAREGTRVSAHPCDVSSEAQVVAFADAVREAHESDHVDLLFNNAGIGGTLSFIADSRSDWERVFNVCWGGVYLCTRAFMPMLRASQDAWLVNTSSINGFWASLGPTQAHTAYSAAKFAVKGFSEALITDLRLHAPQVKVAVVMPGHIGTDIALNTRKFLDGEDTRARQVAALRAHLSNEGVDERAMTDAEVEAAGDTLVAAFRDRAPMNAAQAATEILRGLRDNRWRILVGEDAKQLDTLVRRAPEKAYDPDFFAFLSGRPPS